MTDAVLVGALAGGDRRPDHGREQRLGGDERRVRIPGDIDAERAAEVEEAIWDRLHFATHLRSQRLGEYTIGMDLHRSESLALVQLLILYHVVTARAALSIGGSPPRADPRFPPGSDSLALVQLLILYHVVTARAALSIGGSPPRADPRFPTGADSALHA